ncbi:hypothetical protein QYE76_001449 [Lolium multiflorum]|uniref:Uncharacterized protein n=1 Tax=Lolium multiflorum TaxID=4521 RepID=A0AAD8RL83_LOLMU|nr:hypothetical protein QYE76_001449 [Lolium multiflorum]
MGGGDMEPMDGETRNWYRATAATSSEPSVLRRLHRLLPAYLTIYLCRSLADVHRRLVGRRSRSPRRVRNWSADTAVLAGTADEPVSV